MSDVRFETRRSDRLIEGPLNGGFTVIAIKGFNFQNVEDFILVHTRV